MTGDQAPVAHPDNRWTVDRDGNPRCGDIRIVPDRAPGVGVRLGGTPTIVIEAGAHAALAAALNGPTTCPYVVTSGEGTSYCRLAEHPFTYRRLASRMSRLEDAVGLLAQTDPPDPIHSDPEKWR